MELDGDSADSKADQDSPPLARQLACRYRQTFKMLPIGRESSERSFFLGAGTDLAQSESEQELDDRTALG